MQEPVDLLAVSLSGLLHVVNSRPCDAANRRAARLSGQACWSALGHLRKDVSPIDGLNRSFQDQQTDSGLHVGTGLPRTPRQSVDIAGSSHAERIDQPVFRAPCITIRSAYWRNGRLNPTGELSYVAWRGHAYRIKLAQ